MLAVKVDGEKLPLKVYFLKAFVSYEYEVRSLDG